MKYLNTLTLFFILHSVLLVYLSNRILSRGIAHRIERYLAIFILSIGNLILSAAFVSIFNRLNNPYLYFSASIVLLLIVDVATRRYAVKIYFVPKTGGAGPITEAKTTQRFDLFLISSLSSIAVGMFLICIFSYPTVHDTITLKLPRVFFHIQDGNLLPSSVTDDKRTYFNPLYLYLQWMFFVIYKQSPHFIMLFAFLNWLLIGGAVYRLGKELGASTRGAFLATWFLLMTKMMIFHGTESDDIVCATPFLIGMLFFLKWLKEDSHWYAALSLLGIGISLGTKNSGMAYIVTIVAGVLYLFLTRKISEMRTWFHTRRTSLIAAFASFLIIMTPLIATNVIEKGSPWPTPPNLDKLQNKPFDYSCAAQNLKIYSYRFLFNVFPDFVNPVRPDIREAEVKKYNDFFVDRFILKGKPIECNPYGLDTIPIAAYDIYDHSTEFGLLSWLIAFALIAVFLQKKYLFKAPFWFGISFIFWVILFCVGMKYTGEVQRYWILSVALVTPLVGVWWDDLESAQNLRASFFKVIISLCIMGTVILSWNALFENTDMDRNLINVFRLKPPRPWSDNISNNVRRVVKNANDLNIVHKYGMNLWDYMVMNPDARFFSKTTIVPSVTNVLTFKFKPIINNESFLAYPIFVPLYYPSSANKGFAHLGQALMNGLVYEDVFANNLPASLIDEFPQRYIIFKINKPFPEENSQNMSSQVEFYDRTNNAGNLEFAIYADYGQRTLKQIVPWNKELAWKVVFDRSARNLVIMCRTTDAPHTIYKVSYPVSGLVDAQSILTQAIVPDIIADMVHSESPENIKLSGMGPVEGPYPQWKLPVIRWAKKPSIKITFETSDIAEPKRLYLSFRPHIIDDAMMLVKLNGKVLKQYKLTRADVWIDELLSINAKKGSNVIELSFPVMTPPVDSQYMLFRALTLGGKSLDRFPVTAARINADFIKESPPVDVVVSGLGPLEGPYPKWKLPVVKWATKSTVTISFEATDPAKPKKFTMSFRPQVTANASMLVKLNGNELKQYTLTHATVWNDDVLIINAKKGTNVIELSFPASPPPKDSLYMLFKTLTLESQ